MDYYEEFKQKGLEPLAEITGRKIKIPCVDDEGFKYFLSPDLVIDKRTKNFDRWDKTNPFKPYNMRLLASRKQENCVILSTDEELFEASTKKVKFICPNCGKIYEKKWCHWIGQPDNQHFCSEYSHKNCGEERVYTYEKLQSMYRERGLILLADYDYYLSHNRSYARMECMDAEGYKYAINLNTLRNNFECSGRYISKNPYSIYNLQKWCDEHNVNLKIIEWEKQERRNLVKVLCSCGEHYFYSEPYKIMWGIQTRCFICSKKESSYENQVREWLEHNGIDYEKEYRFEDCRYKRALPFDFKCEKNGQIILIEVDGAQHYKEAKLFGNNLEAQQTRDEIKNQYCKDHNYILIRIPFWEFDKKKTWKKKLQCLL